MLEKVSCCLASITPKSALPNPSLVPYPRPQLALRGSECEFLRWDRPRRQSNSSRLKQITRHIARLCSARAQHYAAGLRIADFGVSLVKLNYLKLACDKHEMISTVILQVASEKGSFQTSQIFDLQI